MPDDKQQKKIDKALQILNAVNEDFTSPEDVAAVIIPLNEKVDLLAREVDKAHESIANDLGSLDVKIDNEIELISEKVREVKDKILDIESEPEEWGTKEEVAKLIEEKLPEPADFTPLYEKLRQVEAKIKPFPKATVPPEVWKEFDAIEKEIADLKKEISKKQKGATSIFGGSKGIELYVDGVLKGSPGNYINLIAGTNLTLTHTTVGARHDILIDATGGGSGFTKLTATGTVDGLNAAFTFTQKPLYIISDGAWYPELDNNGVAQWTWAAGPLTLTMVVPPTASIYGFV